MENRKSSASELKICIREVQNVVINFRKINKRGDAYLRLESNMNNVEFNVIHTKKVFLLDR